MSKEYWKKWLEAALIRAVRTFAQGAISVIPLEVSITEVSWMHVLGCGALAAVLSLLTSLAGLPEVPDDTK